MEKELYTGAIKLRDKLTRALLKMDLEESHILMDLICSCANFEVMCLKALRAKQEQALGSKVKGAEITG